jgi:hypothetical protein
MGAAKSISLPASRVVLISSGILIACWSVTRPWLRAGLGSDRRTYSGSDLETMTIPLGVLCGGAAIGLAISALARVEDARRLTAVAGLVIAAMTGLTILAVEMAAAAIPTRLLPATARRFTVELSAGPGLWLAFTGGATIALAAGVRWRTGVSELITALASSRRDRQVAIAFGVIAVAAVGFARLRYSVWLEAGAVGRDANLEAWALPYLGPWSLGAVWLLVAAAGLVLVARHQLAAAVAGCGGWLITLLSAGPLLAGDWLGRLRFDQITPERINGLLDPSFNSTPSVWLAYASGLSAAAGGAILLTVPREA